MKRIALSIVVMLVVVGFLVVIFWTRITVRESGHGFVVGDHLVLGEFGYSRGGDRLRYAIFRTWPNDSTPEQRALDTRTGWDALGWRLIRDKNGRMIPVGADGDLYFFEGDELKTMKVRMNEHTHTMPLDDLKSLEEVWTHLQQFQIDNRD